MAVRPDSKPEAAVEIPRRLCHLNLGFLRDKALREILAGAGYELHFGRPRPEDGVVVWGASPRAWRGEALAKRYIVPLIRLEDSFLRSIHPGRLGEAPLGLLIDPRGLHFDAAQPSQIEHILSTDPLDNSNLLARAKLGYARIQALDLSKYNNHDSSAALPPPGYILVVDQIREDAAVRASGGGAADFDDMLAEARAAYPKARIVIKTHPETRAGLRPGYYSARHLDDQTQLLSDPVSPLKLLEGAIAVYTFSSQLGFEAIMAGHRPVVWGQPFYAGWGLSEDRNPIAQRNRKLTRNQLFAAAMILAPLWYDHARKRVCSFEAALDQFEAEIRAYREDRQGYVASGMRLWKRGRLQRFFGSEKPLHFTDPLERAAKSAEKLGRRLMVWAAKAPPGTTALRVEDGFLRSRGLGAELVPPLSLVCDDLGIYYDPNQVSRFEAHLLAPLPPGGHERATAVLDQLRRLGLTKYNLGGTMAELPPGYRILVPGQVEDDASILRGAGEIRSNLALLRAVRAANPKAIIIWKAHPDVMAGLRPGQIAKDALRGLADVDASDCDMAALLDEVDEVATMTSLTGFEALIRGKKVTTYGAPFYAGWGLTNDRGEIPSRRLRRPDGSLQPRPDLARLVHAALIAYPRYWDPVSRRACPVETALERLASGEIPHPGRFNRWLAKLQGRFASHARLWR